MSIYRKRHIYCHERGYVGIWPIIVISLFIILFWSYASAKTIWRIGEKNDTANEFGLPGSTGSYPAINQEVVHFSPPHDPNDYDWQSFPCRIWPPETSSNPKEIHISYNYPRDLRSPFLRVGARSAVRNFTQGLMVINGEGDTLSGDSRLFSFYTDINTIPVGIIWKGVHEENTLIIKNVSLTSDNDSIFIDYLELLELNDQDQDGDGCLDYEEIEGDVDEDGIENAADHDTVTLLIQARDSTKIKQITLDLQEKNDQGPFFTYLIPFFTSSPDITQRPDEGFFFPYGLFRAYMDIPIEIDTLMISIYTPEDPEDRIDYDNPQFYLYEKNEWRVVPVEILSRHALRFSIELETDQEGKEGDYTREFVITGGLAYLDKLDIDLENTGLCLIKSLRD